MAIVKKNNFILFVFAAYMIVLLGGIPFFHMIGKDGMAYFALAQELFLLVGGALFYSMKEGIASLIRYRIRREQYREVRKLFLQALLLTLVISVGISVLLEIVCPLLIENWLNLPLAVMTVRIAVLGIPFLALAGVFQGYFQGFQMRAPGVHANFIFAAAFLIAGSISAEAFMVYGQKVSNLLHNGRFQYVYGAIGVSAGLVAASVLSLLYLFILYVIFHKSLEKEGNRDREYLKSSESGILLMRSVLGAGGFPALFYLVFAAPGFGLMMAFFLFHKADSAAISQFGEYFAGSRAWLMVLVLLMLILANSSIRKVMYYQEREEMRMAREKLGVLLHRVVVFVLPIAVLMAVLSENLTGLLLGDTQADATAAMQIGCIGIIFGTLGYLFVILLMRFRQSMLTVLIAGGSFLLEMILTVIMMTAGMKGILVPALGQVIYFVLLTVAGFLFVGKELSYRQDWIRGVAIPTALAAVTGVITMLINRFLTPAAGRLTGTLVCIVAGVLCYVILLLASRNMREEELNGSMMGRLLLKLGGLLRFYER